MNLVTLLAATSIAIAALSGCNLKSPESRQIAKEGEERSSAVEAAKNHPASSGNSAATGAPLPPLAGVDVPAPKSADDNSVEHMAHDNHH